MRSACALLVVALALACSPIPDLEGNGYKACTKDAECELDGRACRSGYCSPPPWWKNEFGSRRQLFITNVSEFVLPKGFPIRIPVGADPRPFKPDEVSPKARFVVFDRNVGAQAELPVTIDVTSGTTFDAYFQLPADLSPGGVLADVWIYSDAAPSVSTRPDARGEVFSLNDDFEADMLDDTLWNSDMAVSFPPGDGEVVIQRQGHLWSALDLPGTPGVQLTALFAASPANTCDGLTIGLISSPTPGFNTPYVTAEARGDGDLVVNALRADTLPIEPELLQPVGLPTATSRLDLTVSGHNVSAMLDGVVISAFTMRGPIDEDLRAHFFVEPTTAGGTCTLTLKQARMRAAVDPEPEIKAGKRIARPE